jgi:hypothetical protein
MSKIVINSIIDSKFDNVLLNERDHLVAKMIPIVGDSIMNRIFYPDSEVESSFNQLNDLPAPNRHPKLNGEDVSAFHPAATNAFNIGAFIKNPVKSDKSVSCELCIDIELANKFDDGVELIKRIKNGGFIGVSTGLTAKIENVANNNYDCIATDYVFDHVAILLREDPAGGEDTRVLNCKIINDETNQKGETMNLLEMIAKEEAIAGEALKAILNKVSKEDMSLIISNGLKESGQKIVNAKESSELEFIKSNKQLIMNLLQKDKEQKEVLINEVVEKVGLLKEDAEKLSEVSLKNMLDKIKVQDYSANAPASIKNNVEDINKMLGESGFFKEEK